MSGLDGLGWLINDDQEKADGGCPSSTPETDEAWEAVSRTPDGMYDSRVPISTYACAMLNHSRKMERERDAAVAVIATIEERYIDGCDTYKDWKFMGDTAREFLSENA